MNEPLTKGDEEPDPNQTTGSWMGQDKRMLDLFAKGSSPMHDSRDVALRVEG